jgi:hypothetical protein
MPLVLCPDLVAHPFTVWLSLIVASRMAKQAGAEVSGVTIRDLEARVEAKTAEVRWGKEPREEGCRLG